MALFKILDSAHAQPEFFRAVTMIQMYHCLQSEFEFCLECEVNIVSKFGNAFVVHIEMCFHKLTSCVVSLEMCLWMLKCVFSKYRVVLSVWKCVVDIEMSFR